MKQNINLQEQLNKRTKKTLNKELEEIKMKLLRLKNNKELVEAQGELYYEINAAIGMIIDLQHEIPEIKEEKHMTTKNDLNITINILIEN